MILAEGLTNAGIAARLFITARAGRPVGGLVRPGPQLGVAAVRRRGVPAPDAALLHHGGLWAAVAGGYHEVREPAHAPHKELLLAECEQGLAQAGQVLRGAVDVGADAQQGFGHVAGGPGDRGGGGDEAVLGE